MKRPVPWSRNGVLVIVAGGLLAVACGSGASGGPGTTGVGSGGSVSGNGSGGAGSGGSFGTGGAAVSLSSGGSPGSGGTVTPAGTGGTTTGSTGGLSQPTGSGGRGSGGRASSGGGGTAGALGTGSPGTGGAPTNCVIPTPVSFQRNVQPFLITTCGGSSGCHIIDGASTMSAGGFNHAYDWLTAGSHASSCPTNSPKRFEVVIAVIDAANPPSCSRSRLMPPPDATGTGKRAPLTACQVATLQAWLDEPLVTQMHRADDSSPTTPYPMPPFN